MSMAMADTSRVLVLGAGGFVGRHVLAALAADGRHAPVAATRSGRVPAGAPPGVPGLALDAADPAALRQVLAGGGYGGVVDCTAGGPGAILAGARALRQAWSALGDAAPRLVYLSSMAVYGGQEGLVDEEAPLDAAAPATGYGGAKVEADGLLRATGAVVLRPGCIYGGGSPQWSVRIARLLQARRIGDLGADGDGIANLVHVADVARTAAAAVAAPGLEGRAFNLSMAGAPTWNGYFLAFAKALGAVPVRRIGGRLLKLETRLFAPALKIAEIAAGKAGLGTDRFPPPIPPSLLRLWRQEIRLDSTRAESALGLQWTPLSAEQLAASVRQGLAVVR